MDLVLTAWAIGWIAMGAGVAGEVRDLSSLSDTAGTIGRAVEQTGGTLRSLDGLPLVGGQLSASGRAITEAGRSTQVSARRSRHSARRVAVLLGLSIAAIPSLPVLLLYIPGRLALARDRRAIRRAVAAEGDRGLEQVLAIRAIAHLPYHRLRKISRDANADLAAGRHHALAEAELARIGLHRRP